MADELRNIRFIGAIIVTLSALATAFVASVLLRPSSEAYLFGPTPPALGGVAVAAFLALVHFALGLGLFGLRKWGYVLAKVFLYALLPAFPIGTIIAQRGLEYLRRPTVRRYFGLEMHPS